MLSTYVFNLSKQLWGKKWRNAVMWSVKDGPKRFSEIHSDMPNCSVKILSQVLKEMEKNHILIRTQYNTIPVKVTYTINPELLPMLQTLEEYHNQLVKYFYRNADQHKIPENRRLELNSLLGK